MDQSQYYFVQTGNEAFCSVGFIPLEWSNLEPWMSSPIHQIFKLESNQTVVSGYIKTGLCPTFQILTRLSHNVNDRMLESQFKCQTVKCQTAKCLPNILMNLQKLIYI